MEFGDASTPITLRNLFPDYWFSAEKRAKYCTAIAGAGRVGRIKHLS